MRSKAVQSVHENGAKRIGSAIATTKDKATSGATGMSGTVKMTETATTPNRAVTVTTVLRPRAPRE